MICPECGDELREERNQLSEDEWSVIISCESSCCSFSLETESNISYRERQERLSEETDISI